MHNDRGRTALDNVYRDVERTAQGENLGLATPYGGTAHGSAVPLKLRGAHQPRVCRTRGILAGFRGKEGKKVVWVAKHIVCGRCAGGGVGRLGRRENSEERELIGNGGEEAMTIRVDLVSAPLGGSWD